MRVRTADAQDIPWLLAQLREFAASHPIGPRIMGTDENAEALLGHLIATQFVAVADAEGSPVGLIAGAVTPHPFNPDLLVASELWWFVAPAHRGSRAGLALLEAYEDWAKANADVRGMTLEANSPVNPRVLVKRGYQLAETQYVAVC